jgi:glycosyltransferase involved in cell wall biosynthesis
MIYDTANMNAPNPGLRHILLMVGTWRNGGLEEMLLDLAKGFIERGIRVTIASAEEPLQPVLARIGQDIGFCTAGFDFSLEAMLDYVKQEGISLVHYHNAVLGAGQFKKGSVATVYTFHGSYIWLSQTERDRLKTALEKFDAIIAVSHQVQTFTNFCFGVDLARIQIISNGVRTLQALSVNKGDKFIGSKASELGAPFSFICVATFHRLKGQAYLLRAFANIIRQFTFVKLTLIGWPADGEFVKEIFNLRQSLDLTSSVSIKLGCERSEVIGLLCEHDCFVLPSLVEGCSLSIIEAAICGVPIVASNVGAASELASLSDGVLLMAPFFERLESVGPELWDTVARPCPSFEVGLENAMRKVIRNHRQFAESAKLVQRKIENCYSVDNMIQDHLRCYGHAQVSAQA